MILITLIENAFKHGAMKSAGKAWIKIEIVCKNERVNVMIRNGWSSQNSGSGIGLQNLRNQLDLLYPQSYDFRIEDRPPGEFSVNLSFKSPA